MAQSRPQILRSSRWGRVFYGLTAVRFLLWTIPQDPGPEARFATAAAKHKIELRDLLETRGVRALPSPLEMTVRRAASLLNEQLQDHGIYPSPGGESAGPLGVLFYSYEGNALETWVLARTGLRGYARQGSQSRSSRPSPNDFGVPSGFRGPKPLELRPEASAPRPLLQEHPPTWATPSNGPAMCSFQPKSAGGCQG